MVRTKRSFNWFKGTVLVLFLLEASGCSTLMGLQHEEENVFFDANIPNVEVACSGRRTKTPGSLPLRQNKSHTCTAELEGYKTQIFKIHSGVSWAGFAHSTASNTAAWGWWTLGIGTGIGWLTDLASGAMKRVSEDTIHLQMQPLQKEGGGKE